MRFDLKIAVTLLLTEEKRKANLWFTAQNKHWGGLRCFWKSQGRGQEQWIFLPRLTIYDDENWFSEAGSPLEIQINFADRLSKSFSKLILLSEIAQRSWRWTLRGRCYHLNRRGKEAEQIFKNNTVLVINCSGIIHTSEIIFHFNCDMIVSDRAGKSFLFWKLQGKNEIQIVIFSFRWLS